MCRVWRVSGSGVRIQADLGIKMDGHVPVVLLLLVTPMPRRPTGEAEQCPAISYQ